MYPIIKTIVGFVGTDSPPIVFTTYSKQKRVWYKVRLLHECAALVSRTHPFSILPEFFDEYHYFVDDLSLQVLCNDFVLPCQV